MQPNQNLAFLTSGVLQGVHDLLEKEHFDWVIVQGDTTSSMAASMAAFYQNYIRDTGGLVWWVWRTSANKTIGSFVNPNHFGAFCAALMGLPVSVFFSSLKNKELNKVPFAIISLIILVIL